MTSVQLNCRQFKWGMTGILLFSQHLPVELLVPYRDKALASPAASWYRWNNFIKLEITLTQDLLLENKSVWWLGEGGGGGLRRHLQAMESHSLSLSPCLSVSVSVSLSLSVFLSLSLFRSPSCPLSPYFPLSPMWRAFDERIIFCMPLLMNASPLPPPRILTRLLELSDDPQVIAVAAHDVGEYVRHYPRGKRYGLVVCCRCLLSLLLSAACWHRRHPPHVHFKCICIGPSSQLQPHTAFTDPLYIRQHLTPLSAFLFGWQEILNPPTVLWSLVLAVWPDPSSHFLCKCLLFWEIRIGTRPLGLPRGHFTMTRMSFSCSHCSLRFIMSHHLPQQMLYRIAEWDCPSFCSVFSNDHTHALWSPTPESFNFRQSHMWRYYAAVPSANSDRLDHTQRRCLAMCPLQLTVTFSLSLSLSLSLTLALTHSLLSHLGVEWSSSWGESS